MRLLQAWLPVILLEAIVVFLSSRPGGSIQLPFARVDKVLHFVEYAALGFVLYRAIRMSGGRPGAAAVGTWVLVALLGFGDEALQSQIPGRDASIHDWFADLLGGAAGVWAGRCAERFVPRSFGLRGGPAGSDDLRSGTARSPGSTP